MQSSSDTICQWARQVAADVPTGWVFPTDGELADTFEVSIRTVRRAMAKLAGEGVVVRRHGGRTSLPPVDKPASAPPRGYRSAVTRLADDISELISGGSLQIGMAMPSLTYIRFQFHVSQATASNAYRLLERRGLVRRVGKGYLVGTVRDSIVPAPKKEILFVAQDDSTFAEIYKRDRFRHAFIRMERELASNGYCLRFARSEDGNDAIRSAVINDGNFYGMIVWGVSEDHWSNIVRLLAESYRAKKRILPLLAIGGNMITAQKGAVIVSRGHATTVVARAVARFAHESRFLRVIFFHDTGSDPEFVSPAMLFKLHGELAAAGSSQPFLAMVKSELETFDEWYSRHVAGFGDSWLKEAMGLEPERARIRLSRTTRLVTKFVSPGGRAEKDLWIFSKDGDAAAALEWAEGLRLSVPGDLAIISLQNDPAFFHKGISCCVPDYDCMGYLMAHALIGDVPIQKTRRGFMEIQPLWLHRHTTR